MATADEWANRAHEIVHASAVPGQDFSAFDEAGNPLGIQVQVSLRVQFVGAEMTNSLDIKRAYHRFLDDHGDDAVLYFARAIAGFTVKELTEKTGLADEAIRESIERGRSEWGNALRRIGIRAQWR